MAGLLGGALENAVSGLTRNRQGTRLVSQNLANAGQEGYHVRSAKVETTDSNRAGAVKYVGVERAKSVELARAARDENGEHAGVAARSDILRSVGERIGDPGDRGSLSNRLSEFRTTLQDLVEAPSDETRQLRAKKAARDVAQEVRGLTNEVQKARERADKRIGEEVERVNDALKKVHDLNEQIARVEQTSKEAATLKDERGRQIDRISEALGVRVEAGSEGRVDLYTKQGVTLLDEEHGPVELQFTRTPNIGADDIHKPSTWPGSAESWDGYDGALSGISVRHGEGAAVEITPTNTPDSIISGASSVPASNDQAIQQGRLAGLLQARDGDLVDAQARLDKVAESLVQTFQDNGVDPTTADNADSSDDNQPNKPGLFYAEASKQVPASSGGGSFNLDADTTYPVSGSASYTTEADRDYHSRYRVGLASEIRVQDKDPDMLRDGVHAETEKPDGDSSQVRSFLEALTNENVTTLDGEQMSFAGAAEDAVSKVQATRSAVETEAEAKKAAANAAQEARQNTVGVDQDKQMQSLMELQRAYQANTRVVQKVDQMFNTLLQATR